MVRYGLAGTLLAFATDSLLACNKMHQLHETVFQQPNDWEEQRSDATSIVQNLTTWWRACLGLPCNLLSCGRVKQTARSPISSPMPISSGSARHSTTFPAQVPEQYPATGGDLRSLASHWSAAAAMLEYFAESAGPQAPIVQRLIRSREAKIDPQGAVGHSGPENRRVHVHSTLLYYIHIGRCWQQQQSASERLPSHMRNIFMHIL